MQWDLTTFGTLLDAGQPALPPTGITTTDMSSEGYLLLAKQVTVALLSHGLSSVLLEQKVELAG